MYALNEWYAIKSKDVIHAHSMMAAQRRVAAAAVANPLARVANVVVVGCRCQSEQGAAKKTYKQKRAKRISKVMYQTTTTTAVTENV